MSKINPSLAEALAAAPNEPQAVIILCDRNCASVEVALRRLGKDRFKVLSELDMISATLNKDDVSEIEKLSTVMAIELDGEVGIQ